MERFTQRYCRGLLSFVLFAVVAGTLLSALVLCTPAVAMAQDAPAAEKGSDNVVIHFFRSIGWVFGLIFAMISVGLIAMVIILFLDLRMEDAIPPAFVDDFTDLVNKRQFKQAYEICKEETSYLGRVMTQGMARLQYGIEDSREAMYAMVDTVKSSKESWISYLATIGTLGPLLGLVGTVSGMIGAFKKLGESSQAPDAQGLAGEISHALVVTLVGVAVSVPAIFFYTLFKNRLTAISMAVSNLADDLLTQLYHNSKKTAAAPTQAAGAAPPTVNAATNVSPAR